jgi:hypothetical protein
MTLLRQLLLVLVLLLASVAPLVAQPTCLSDHQCADGNLCNGIERCVAGTCEGPTAPLACDDGDPCTTDSCDPAAGCAHADVACPASCGPGDDGLRCSDGTACTVSDVCSGGTCVGTPLACADADPCTSDSCDATLGCVYVEQADPPACLSNSQCVMAADHTPCVGDGEPCTIDGCLEGACQIGLNFIQRQCADGDACNGDEYCSTVKACEPGPAPVCDDGDLCNGTESCAPASGCVPGSPAPNGTPCDDGFGCSGPDDCNGGACVGPPVTCPDGDPTTMDLCLEGAGCLHCAPLDAARLTLRLPSPTKSGRITAAGRFVPAAPFTPTGPAGAEFVLHDGSTVVQSSHVPPGAFTTNGSGTVARFVDRSATVVPGLERLRIKTAMPGERHQFSATGRTLSSSLAHAPSRSLTLRAGATCATATLSCSASAGGKSDRCK